MAGLREKETTTMKHPAWAPGALVGVCLVFAAAPVLGHEATGANVRTWSEIDDVRVATGAYHSLDTAIADGFVPFDVGGGDVATCFDSEAGGMGVHYVRHIDDIVTATDPESLVYELTPDGGHRLVAVEYIVPQEFVEDAKGEVVTLPRVLGHDFHKHPTLPVYILHAWVWESNPDDPFADFNPNVAACGVGGSTASVAAGRPWSLGVPNR